MKYDELNAELDEAVMTVIGNAEPNAKGWVSHVSRVPAIVRQGASYDRGLYGVVQVWHCNTAAGLRRAAQGQSNWARQPSVPDHLAELRSIPPPLPHGRASASGAGASASGGGLGKNGGRSR